jgi:hypothetical protein
MIECDRLRMSEDDFIERFKIIGENEEENKVEFF